FTHLRSDGFWTLNRNVKMARVNPLAEHDVVGQLDNQIEEFLRRHPATLTTAARLIVEGEFPATVAPDVLLAVGLDPDVVLTAPSATSRLRLRRDVRWPAAILAAWDRQCAFCGFDGQLGGAAVGLEAAHVRWFNYDGPDTLDNGLALCALH